MDPNEKIDDHLRTLLGSSTKPRTVSVIIQTVDGLKEEDRGLIGSCNGVITDNLWLINSYVAELPSDLSVVIRLARDSRLTRIWLNRELQRRVLIHTVMGLTDQEKEFIHSRGGDIVAEFLSIKSYLADLPGSVITELTRGNPELAIVYDVPDRLSMSDLLRRAKVFSTLEDLAREVHALTERPRP